MEVRKARETKVKCMGGFVEIDRGVLGMRDNQTEIADGIIDGVKVIEVTIIVAVEGVDEDAYIKVADDEPERVKALEMGIDRGGFCWGFSGAQRLAHWAGEMEAACEQACAKGKEKTHKA